MKITRYFILFFILFSWFSVLSQAQQNETRIKGYIFNPEKTPAIFSTAILLNQDSVIMKGVLTGEDGAFVFDNINAGKYFVKVTNIEFKNYISKPILIKKNEQILLDSIILATNSFKLNAVEIVGRKALVEVHADKMVFNVASSVNASGNNGLELLSKAPGVLVDMDNNIILQGKSGVQIFIDGRPSRLSGKDLTNFLESIRSDNIESIEIITNPSSKYDAEGTGGIINIKLKKNTSLGFNGNVIGSYSKGVFPRSSVGTTLNYSGRKINLFTTLNYSDNRFQEDIRESSYQSGYFIDQQSKSETHRKSYNFSGGMDYTINARQSISMDGRVFINKGDRTLNSSTGIYDSVNMEDGEILISQALDEIPSENYNFNFSYRYSIDSTSNLSSDFSLGKYSSTKNTFQPNDYYTIIGDTLLRSVNNQYDANTQIDLWSVMVDYEKRFKKISFSSGAKYSYISTGNQLAFYDIENETPVLDITKSNNFDYLEKVAALYFIINAKVNDKITVNAGLRMESTSSLGTLKSEIQTENSKVERNYTDFFPNVSIAYDDQKNSVLSASIGRRITRPNYQDLNPFESRTSELSAWKGNPFLNPNYITNYQLTYSFKRKLVISNTYSVTKDFFANVFEITEGAGNILSPRNLQRAINNGLSVSYPLKVTKWWNFTTFMVYNYSSFNGTIGNTVIDLKANIYNFRLQNSLNLPGKITMELTYYYTSPWIWGGTVNVDGGYAINFGIKKDFLDKKLLLQVTGSDIFRGRSDFHYKSNYGGKDVDGVISFDNQRFGINATYNFGNQKAKATKKRKSAIDDDLNRISN
ncbi:MAG: TonB-dependent receptor [Bacteroidales bacterium]|nr:TonB-dependent receptor [Bacteroidales bacterium]